MFVVEGVSGAKPSQLLAGRPLTISEPKLSFISNDLGMSLQSIHFIVETSVQTHAHTHTINKDESV